ncbi:MAG TPA: PAS domain S-box protein [Candidatus Dormibacteraeota bacterium]|nr:PAS domain S-box protein [Candidatus Dormibacteraeota bacterium]
MVEDQGLLGIAFFEATAFVILLVLFLLLRRDQVAGYYRSWLAGWILLTISSFCEMGILLHNFPGLRLVASASQFAALLLLLGSVLEFARPETARLTSLLPLAGVSFLAFCYFERSPSLHFADLHWQSGILESLLCLTGGWILWRAPAVSSPHGTRLLSATILLKGLNGIDRFLWPASPYFVFRFAFDHLMAASMGVAMVVVVLELARSRAEEINEKMRRLTLMTGRTQSLSQQELLDQMLEQLVRSLGGTHGMIRMLEGEGVGLRLVAKASIGFSKQYVQRYRNLALSEPWAKTALTENYSLSRFDEEKDPKVRERMSEERLAGMAALSLRGKEGPIGIIVIGLRHNQRFQLDEIDYLINLANFLGMTLENVELFEKLRAIEQQWANTFDSIGDPILVHDPQGRILRNNSRLGHFLGKEGVTLIGRVVSSLLSPTSLHFDVCPYCEELAGQGDDLDPWLRGYFLASNSTITDPAGNPLGTVHVLKDITERKRAEEKYRTLISNVREGVFISTPQGHFLDFNDALMRMLGYENREELLRIDLSHLYVNPADRERMKKLLHEHGAVSDFEFEIKRKDGEIRTVIESSTAVRNADGTVSAYQGFLLDISERKRAEHEIRRRNRELMVLNSIAQTLTESMDLSDSLHRTLRQMTELFSLDATSLYLFEDAGKILRRVAAVGLRSEFSRHFPPTPVNPELLEQIRSVHARFLSAQGLALPAIFREALRREALISAYVVILWSKDKVLGGFVVGSRTPREYSPADINLLIAAGSQISSAIERTLLYEETRQAYDNLRRTQEQLLHSEKMAAVGQLIAGVAHELNNPLTAILGYSQLLTTSGQIGPQGIEYSEKLYKQAQRTHRIVQNLLSFARQHKPERSPVQINQILEDTLALRDYDLRMSNIRVQLELAPGLPTISADPHQLQQVFLNLVNNAVDAMLEKSPEGDLSVKTSARENFIVVEFTDSGPGVADASRVFDPFYTTKPVGKGTGLGLSICYGIITEHGGAIRVHNAQPKGACFTIELPLNISDSVLPGEINAASPAHVLAVRQPTPAEG